MGQKAPQIRISIDAPGGWGALLEAFKNCVTVI
jgi:hypothetical protein